MTEQYDAGRISTTPLFGRDLKKRMKAGIHSKTANKDGLSLLRLTEKEGNKTYVQEVPQEAWESADDWFTE